MLGRGRRFGLGFGFGVGGLWRFRARVGLYLWMGELLDEIVVLGMPFSWISHSLESNNGSRIAARGLMYYVCTGGS